ncbi:hypothetical protein RRG08_020850 [Elysia crispata]|uniref:Uncharacterized protein n=1 Tax=Elysia crispata TaxID=231223 RepID=A0AAE1CMH7_9GAST|nr:hypothetical protein RRG08_020850 [Elysia crispata]
MINNKRKEHNKPIKLRSLPSHNSSHSPPFPPVFRRSTSPPLPLLTTALLTPLPVQAHTSRAIMRGTTTMLTQEFTTHLPARERNEHRCCIVIRERLTSLASRAWGEGGGKR